MSTNSAPPAASRLIRRLSVYWQSGLGHTFTIEPEDTLANNYTQPEDWDPETMGGYQPPPMAERQIFIIRGRTEGTGVVTDQEEIMINQVAWIRFMEYRDGEKPKEKAIGSIQNVADKRPKLRG